MCGIIGFSGKNFSNNELKKSISLLKHRGPNESIIKNFIKNDVGLGMTRLAIRDLKKNLYPFQKKDLFLIYNGEIYNGNELFKQIDNKSTKKISCDAEIILPLFIKYGPKAFSMFQGMFAIAIYDKSNHKIYLARDKFGEKPLYYNQSKNGLYFSSEIKAFPKKIMSFDDSQIIDYFTFGFLPSNKTFFKNTYEVLAGEYVEYDCKSNTLKAKTYYNFNDDLQKTTKKISTKTLEKDLIDTITTKLQSDVPIGTFLSGGLDSSIITTIAKNNHKNKLHTFSIYFPNSSYNEEQYARKISKSLGTIHHPISLTSKIVKKDWKNIISNLDQPMSDPALIPTYFLAKEAKKHVTVILSGEGADEIFSGYNRYQNELFLEKNKQKVPQAIKMLLTKFSLYSSNYKLYNLFSNYTNHYLSTFLNTRWIGSFKNRLSYIKRINVIWTNLSLKLNFTKKTNKLHEKIKQIQLFDLSYYIPQQLCRKTDSMSMMHSIESRAPFLDSTFIKYMNLATKLATKTSTSKPLLRLAVKNIISKDAIKRPKHGFTVPIWQWLDNDLHFLEKEILENTHNKVLKFVSKKDIKKLILNTHQEHVGSSMSLWSIIILDQWLKTHKI